MEAKDSAKTDAQEDEDKKVGLGITDTRTTLEERRKSLLDHHWAIPSKDRLVFAQLPHELCEQLMIVLRPLFFVAPFLDVFHILLSIVIQIIIR